MFLRREWKEPSGRIEHVLGEVRLDLGELGPSDQEAEDGMILCHGRGIIMG